MEVVNASGSKRMSLTGICSELDELLERADLVCHFDKMVFQPGVEINRVKYRGDRKWTVNGRMSAR